MNFAPPSKTDRNISFFEFDTEGKQANVREYTISLPKGKSEFSEDRDLSVSEDVVLSPHGDRLAWLIHVVEKPSSIITFLAKWFSSMHPVSRYVLKLYTSRLDGSDVQEIGYMEIKGKPSATNLPRLLRWLPDGKRLSFVYQGALWTVPAD